MRDAIIIGAGPAGSSLAAALAGRGWRVLLLEQRRRFGHKVCGEFISWEAQEILRTQGLLASVRAAGPTPLERAMLTSRSGLTARIPVPAESWGLSRRSLDAALAGAAQGAGAELRMGTRVQRFERTKGGYRVEARSNGRAIEVECRALIAAGGRVGSAELPPRSHSTSSGLVGIKRHYANVRMPPQVELYFFDGGYVGLAPIEGGAVNLCLLASRRSLDGAGRDPDILIAQLADRLPGIGRRLAGAEPLHPTPLAVAPVDLWRGAEPWDMVACVGDAAATIPPLTGDGIAAALRSAKLCAPLAHAFLSDELTLEEWEQAYRRSWHAAFDAPLALARRLEAALGARLPSELLLGLGCLLPPIARKLAELTRSRATPAPPPSAEGRPPVAETLHSPSKNRRS